jgi:hypothetical protein
MARGILQANLHIDRAREESEAEAFARIHHQAKFMAGAVEAGDPLEITAGGYTLKATVVSSGKTDEAGHASES